MPAMRINIDRAHIERAIKGDASHCMIAEAIREKIPDARWILVDLQTIRWTLRKEGLRYQYLTPLSAQRALLKFDRGESLAPFSLGLSGPPIVRSLHPLVRRSSKKVRKTKNAKPNTARYKHKKVAAETATERKFGLRGLQ